MTDLLLRLAREVMGPDAVLETDLAEGMHVLRVVGGKASRAVQVPAGPGAEVDARRALHQQLLAEQGRMAKAREELDEIIASADRGRGRHIR